MLFHLHSGQTEGQSEGTEKIQDRFKKCVVIAKNLSKAGEK